MTTIEIEYYLFQHLFKQSELITFRITKNTRIVNHECDVLVVDKKLYLKEFEIKINKADLLKDLCKKHQHSDNRIRQVNFIVPKILQEDCLNFINKDFGVWIINKDYSIQCIRKAKINKNATPVNSETLLKLYRPDSVKKGTYIKKNHQLY